MGNLCYSTCWWKVGFNLAMKSRKPETKLHRCCTAFYIGTLYIACRRQLLAVAFQMMLLWKAFSVWWFFVFTCSLKTINFRCVAGAYETSTQVNINPLCKCGYKACWRCNSNFHQSPQRGFVWERKKNCAMNWYLFTYFKGCLT